MDETETTHDIAAYAKYFLAVQQDCHLYLISSFCATAFFQYSIAITIYIYILKCLLWMECLCPQNSPAETRIQCDGIWRCVWGVISYEGRTLINGISAFIRDQRATHFLSGMWEYNEKSAICIPEEGPHQNPSILAPVLDFQPPEPWETI